MNGREIEAKLAAEGACVEARRWLRENANKPAGWLWAACPNAGWLLWLAGCVATDDVLAAVKRAYYDAPFGDDEASSMRRALGWPVSVAVIRALEAL